MASHPAGNARERVRNVAEVASEKFPEPAPGTRHLSSVPSDN